MSISPAFYLVIILKYCKNKDGRILLLPMSNAMYYFIPLCNCLFNPRTLRLFPSLGIPKGVGVGGGVGTPRTPIVSILLITDRYIWYVCVGLLIIYGYMLLCSLFTYLFLP